ncbi:MAG: nucleotide exchange factor GrpE [Candidatus Staskawiczbacteria bacterium RIFCSPLOWO2_01_FULL_38_12b]|uniref:Protein GrpE n=1 Tax=Candidatus Staskawiczbacteria bacterium RIFCSPLOWO2_01_FULL_38_12b TaxID=1802214 RepID=A0A1G2IBP2_9BACT|nr:MAG: nucleotide exchange factor GrpE [Candidatus Staskawiczbacteria bacterium RIFCSPLOWO2_01_FULL_38_12b]
MTEEQINEEPKSELDECKQKCDEYLNNWKRERADFINYKNDEIKRIGMLAQYTKEETILKMLPILDSIYLAEKQMPEELGNHNWVVGFLQTKKQIDAFLQKEGIGKIEAIDKPFDPNTMEAIEEVEIPSTSLEASQPGIVIEEVQRGYMMDDKVLRPARVKISK